MNDDFAKLVNATLIVLMIVVTLMVGVVVYANALTMYPDNIAAQAGYCAAYVLFLVPAGFIIWLFFIPHNS